jgi:hypothetical protein
MVIKNRLYDGSPIKHRLENCVNAIVPKENSWYPDNFNLTTYEVRPRLIMPRLGSGRLKVTLDLPDCKIDFSVAFDAANLTDEIYKPILGVLHFDI